MGDKIFAALIVLVMLAGCGLFASAASRVSENVAQTTQAQAVIQTARIGQIQATSNAVSSVGITIAIAVLAVLLVAAIVSILVMLAYIRRLHRAQQDPAQLHATPGKWIKGPNAYWGKTQAAPQLDIGFQQLLQENLRLREELHQLSGPPLQLSVPATREQHSLRFKGW
ncbi:MAG TPA: hypothetical protein VLH56_05215 [Dissulfurispiraceae bacterium]|nr:hypothetical protein [Dissulfurispiraceae bacterium]